MINRTFSYKSWHLISTLYKALVRPRLEYCVQAWSPHLQKEIDMLEKVQRRAIRMINEFKGVNYEERLTRLNLTSLEARRMRSDIIQVLKILMGFDNMDRASFFTVSSKGLKGSSLKFFKNSFHTNTGKFSFSNRTVSDWNSLPENVISSTSLTALKIVWIDIISNVGA